MGLNEVSVEVRFSEIDSMNIAHNARYYDWFEVGRFTFTKNIFNFDMNMLLTDYRLPVVKSSCKYLFRIIFGDQLLVKTFMYIDGSTKLRYYYEIYNQNKILCAIGSTQHTILAQNNKLLLQVDEFMKEKFFEAQKMYPECFMSQEQMIRIENRINR